jgi:hypothetical protein
MKFTSIVQEAQKIEESKSIMESMTIDKFVDVIAKYGSLDSAILELDDDMLQYYSDNLSLINRILKKRHLVESQSHGYQSAEDPGYTGWSRSELSKTKNVKYRGHIISLAWNPDLGTWQPTIRFRNVSEALKYGKQLVQDYEAS